MPRRAQNPGGLNSGEAARYRAPGTHVEAVSEGCVALTALHVDLEHPNSELLLSGVQDLLHGL